MVEKTQNKLDIKNIEKKPNIADIFERHEKKLAEIESLEKIRDSIEKVLK